jgi:hypothetical protein
MSLSAERRAEIKTYVVCVENPCSRCRGYTDLLAEIDRLTAELAAAERLKHSTPTREEWAEMATPQPINEEASE